MPDDETVSIPLVWEEADDHSVMFANQFMVQHQPDEFVLTIGQLVPPPLLGTDEEKREQLANVSYVPIRVIGRYGLTRRRIEEVIAVLQENLERHDAMVKSLKEENG